MTENLRCYMFDTNIFSHMLDGGVDALEISGKARYVVTHIQRDEIQRTSDPDRRSRLLGVFHVVTEGTVPTESFVLNVSRLDEAKLGSESIVPTESGVWGVSQWGQFKWPSEDSLYGLIKSRLDQLNKGKKNNIQDALIAETAIKNGFTLVTDDQDLTTVTVEMGGNVIGLGELFKELA